MSTEQDPLLSSLLGASQSDGERDLAARYAPILMFDECEPFFPLAVGYTIFRENGTSLSFERGYEVELTPPDRPPASIAIEYAIWWDWDIGHLYELEHVWIYVDGTGHVVRCEASWHGEYHDMCHQGHLALRGPRAVVYSEPGKHAFAPTPEWFNKRRQEFRRSETSALAGCSGVLITPYLRDRVTRTPLKDRLVRSYLAQHAFEPGGTFTPFTFTPDMFVPWAVLADWIPERVSAWLDRLAQEITPSNYRFLRIGHRGAAAYAPDNTLTAIRKAAELDADMVEFDVQQTADGQVVVVHDATLWDDTGRAWPVRASTLAELQAIDLGGGERVPTLDEVLNLCQEQQLGAYIELKDGAVIEAVARTIEDREWAPFTIVGSFRPDWLMEFKINGPRVDTSILFGSPHLDAVQLARSIQARYVHPCWERFPHPSALLNPAWIDRVRQADLGIICWHEERPQEIAALRKLGIDGICSDTPDRLKADARPRRT